MTSRGPARRPDEQRQTSIPGDRRLGQLKRHLQAFLRSQETAFDELLQPRQHQRSGLDDWQARAVEHLERGDHLIVDAVTTSGKTRVIEEMIERNLGNARFKVVYTSPVKALSNDKFREFKARWGAERVGIMTGDFKENLGASVVVATLESYRNTLLGVESTLRPSLVVFDEYQFLSERERGKAWEEAVILTPDHVQLAFLSASVPNVQDFSDWLKKIKKLPTHVVRNAIRPVPLKSIVFIDGQPVLRDDLEAFFEDLGPSFESESAWFHDLILSNEEVILQAINAGLYPIIVYRGARSNIKEDFAYFASGNVLPPMSAKEGDAIAAYFQEEKDLVPYLPQRLKEAILRKGVAYHTSGLNPLAKILIEGLLKKGLMRVCFGTMGLSLGINFSVRSIFIGDERRPESGGKWKYYSSGELIQMSGRAGRRGIDTVGFVLQAGLSSFDLKVLQPEPCSSSFSLGVNSVLNLMDTLKDETKVIEIFSKSFKYRDRDQIFELQDRNCYSILEVRGEEVGQRAANEAPEELEPSKPLALQQWKRGKVHYGGKLVSVELQRERASKIAAMADKIAILDFRMKPLHVPDDAKKRVRVVKGDGFWVVVDSKRQLSQFLQKFAVENLRGSETAVGEATTAPVKEICRTCRVKPSCDSFLGHDGLVMVRHLMQVGAIRDHELTELGKLGSLFPHMGSLIIADVLLRIFQSGNLSCAEDLLQFGCLCFDSFKGLRHRMYFRHAFYRKLTFYYPKEVFPDQWEFRSNRNEQGGAPYYREYNPLGVDIIRDFATQGDDAWEYVKRTYIDPKYYIEEGDLVHLFMKYLDILRSMKKVGNPELTAEVGRLYAKLWREPISLLVQNF